MKAAFLTGIGKVEIREAAVPALERSDDVLLRVEVVGVCGSDMHYYRTGRIGSQVVQFPWSVGHECAAAVVQVGPAVTGLRAGDRVAVDPLVSCGRCDQCLAGREHTCRSQKFLGCPGQAPGAIAEFLVMPARGCFKVADSMTMVQAALVEPFSIGLYAQRLICNPLAKKIAILGAGPIGLSILAALKAAAPAGGGSHGCTVFMTDLRENRLALARRMGADWTANASSGSDIVAQIQQMVPLGLDCVYEAAGEQQTVDQALELLRPAGALLMVGIPEADRLSFSMDMMRRKELVVQNVRRQNACTADAIGMVASGKVTLDALVTHEFPLDRTAEAFDLVANYRDDVVKAMIRVG